MLKYPIGIQDFRKLREGGFVYIDKTKFVDELLNGGGYYFLSRPRRFGKSLLLNTIQEVFSADRAIFEGLWIADKLAEVAACKVIKIGFSSLGYKENGLKSALELKLKSIAEASGISLLAEDYILQFQELIQKMAGDGQVVILIDEYDKPIIDFIENVPKAKENQDILKAFYSVIKDNDAFIRLFFVTGVSKFSQVSIFSELNNLEDITLISSMNALCGYTQKELEHHFQTPIADLAKKEETSYPAALEKVKKWYNGYSWDGVGRVYNPFSVLNLMKNKEFHNYWFSTGTPTFLVKLLNQDFSYDFSGVEVSPMIFDAYSLDAIDKESLLFQTGYLTIREKNRFSFYILDYPNLEVEAALEAHLLASYTHQPATVATVPAKNIVVALENNEPEEALHIIHSLFKNIPSSLFIKHLEAYYHSILHLSFSIIGHFIDCEVNTSDG